LPDRDRAEVRAGAGSAPDVGRRRAGSSRAGGSARREVGLGLASGSARRDVVLARAGSARRDVGSARDAADSFAAGTDRLRPDGADDGEAAARRAEGNDLLSSRVALT